jgi:IPTL-CTERM motif
MSTTITRLVVALATIAFAVPSSYAANVCFNQAGTFGNLTVTTSGSGCGTFLNFGGINGVWMGDSNVTENCQFNFSPAINGTTLTVALTAHSCVTAGCEEARFSINGTHYAVATGELNNAVPPGGDANQITGAGDIVEAPGGTSDGRGTVSFLHAPTSATSLNINHVVTSGAPAGTIYLVCADDAASGPPPPSATSTPVPTLNEWALYGLTLLLSGLGIYAIRRRRYR